MKKFSFIVILIMLGVAVPVLAAYIGPNRTTTSTTTDYERRGCSWWASHPSYPSGPNCTLTLYYPPGTSCPAPPALVEGYFTAFSCRVPWGGSTGCTGDCTVHFSNTWTETCSPGQSGCTGTTTTTTTTLSPATISGSTTCTTPGNNGWCRSGPGLSLSANEPLSGYQITGIEANTGMLCTNSGSNISCNWAGFPQGQTNLNFWALSSYGDTSSMASAAMQLDSNPPTLSLNIPAPDGPNGWYISAAVVSASASDATSGVASSQISVNGSTWQNSLALPDGIYDLQGRALDVAGNSSTTSINVQVDTIPPLTDLIVSGSPGLNGWLISADLSLDANASDATSGVASVEYKADGGTWQGGSDFSLSEGTHTVEARVADHAGHLSTSSISTRIDSLAPFLDVTSMGLLGTNNWHIAPANFSASASDPSSGLAGVEYRLDAGSWQSGTQVDINSDGVHTLDFRASDLAGNTTVNSISVKLDQLPPTVNLVIPPADGQNGWHVSDVTVSVNATDATSGLVAAGVSQDGLVWLPTLLLMDGRQTVQGQATDNAGNVGLVSASINIDSTPPTISVDLPSVDGQNGWYITLPQVSVSALDATSGVVSSEVRLDGGEWQDINTLAIPDGNHTLEVRASDQAGNQTSETYTVNVDSLTPQSAFTSPVEGSTTTISGVVTFSGVSLDTLSGLSEAEVSLDGGNTWQPLQMTGNDWSFTWNTTSAPNGTYDLLVRASDQAGNRENTARITVVVFNQPTPEIIPTLAITTIIPTLPTSTIMPTTPIIMTEPQLEITPTIHAQIIPSTQTAINQPTSQATPVIATPRVPVHEPQKIDLWPVTTTASLAFLFLTLSMLDPRPAAWRRLARSKIIKS